MARACSRGAATRRRASAGLALYHDPLDLAENGSLFVTRPHLADYIQDTAERRGRAAELLEWLGSGKLQVTIDTVFPLADAKRAHDTIEAGKTKGKLLLEI